MNILISNEYKRSILKLERVNSNDKLKKMWIEFLLQLCIFYVFQNITKQAPEKFCKMVSEELIII